jgi:hypothetical protein
LLQAYVRSSKLNLVRGVHASKLENKIMKSTEEEKKKEKIVQSAYGNLYEKYKININKYSGFTDTKEEKLGFSPLSDEIEYLDFTCSNLWRPISLKGIENNNGWIRIDNKQSIEKINYVGWAFIRVCRENIEDIYCEYVANSIGYFYATHYQPIIKPKSPHF